MGRASIALTRMRHAVVDSSSSPRALPPDVGTVLRARRRSSVIERLDHSFPILRIFADFQLARLPMQFMRHWDRGS
jgi:hypothetical protein